MWKLNNTLLDNQWVKEDITREIRKYHEINENENISELCKTAKAVPRGKLIALNVLCGVVLSCSVMSGSLRC